MSHPTDTPSHNGEAVGEFLTTDTSQPATDQTPASQPVLGCDVPSAVQGAQTEQPAQRAEVAEVTPSAGPVDPEGDAEEEASWGEALPAKPKLKRRSKPSEYAGAGRPSLFRRWMVPVVARMKARNATDAEVAERLGVSLPQFRVWKRENSHISKAAALGEDLALDHVETALFRRAVGWSGPTEKVLRDGRVVRHKQFHPPDTAAAMSVLANRRPDKWKRNIEPSQGLGIQVIINNPRINAALQKHTEAEQPALSVAPEEQD